MNQKLQWQRAEEAQPVRRLMLRFSAALFPPALVVKRRRGGSGAGAVTALEQLCSSHF